MAETTLHRDLVALLYSYMIKYGAVTHAAGRNELGDPPAVGRHEPDVLAKTPAGRLVIGEVKIGEDLDTQHTREQLEDFVAAVHDGDASLFVLCVPPDWQQPAEEAVNAAGGMVGQGVEIVSL